MGHCSHCHSRLHRKFFSAKRFGAIGAALVVLHLGFHMVELLILPAVLLVAGGHATEEPAQAKSEPALATPDQVVSLSPDALDLSNPHFFDALEFGL